MHATYEQTVDRFDQSCLRDVPRRFDQSCLCDVPRQLLGHGPEEDLKSAAGSLLGVTRFL